MPFFLKILFFPIQLLYSIWMWIVCAGAFILHFVIAGIVVPFSTQKEKMHMDLARPIVRVGLLLCGIVVKVHGVHHLPRNQNFIVFSNHQSNLDILLLLVACPYKFSFFAKRELLSVPILGHSIKRQGHFIVNRDNAKEAFSQLENVKNALINGKSLLVFPEGTRTATGAIGPFKRGGFNLAVQTGLPTFPVFIWGAHRRLPKQKFLATPGVVHVYIGSPMAPIKVDGKNKKFALNLKEQIRNKILLMHDAHLKKRS